MRAGALQRARLPDGLEVWTVHPGEAAILHRELFQQPAHLRQGPPLPDGAVVFDVGANIGLFGVALGQRVPGLRLHAFEPIPELFEALRRNLETFVPGAACVNAGLADRAGTARFAFDPRATYAATLHPEIFARGARAGTTPAAWARAVLADLQKVAGPRRAAVLAALRRGLERPGLRGLVLAGLAPLALLHLLRRRARLSERECRLQTLSEALAASGEEAVDLVKIDVEGAEEQVLAGIAPPDWPRLRRFVVEVHDVEGRLDRMAALLEGHGFKVVRDREDWELHGLLGISLLHAWRP